MSARESLNPGEVLYSKPSTLNRHMKGGHMSLTLVCQWYTTWDMIEKECEIELDLEALDAEQITVLGPLSRYVAERGCFRNVPNSDATSS